MKTLKFILAICIFTLGANAQQNDKALARVQYTFIHIIDTTMKDQPNTEQMLLVVGKNASVYTSYDKLNRSLNMQKQLQEQMKNQAGGGNMTISLKSESKKPITDTDIFYFAHEQKLITKERLFNNYLIEEVEPKINWKITKDTTSFSGIACQKATAKFKGRNWVAWFAPELPFQSGPWKLNGLPGLIIEAYDEKKEVKFEFAGLEKIDAQTVKQEDGDKIVVGGNTVEIKGIDMSSTYLGDEISLPKDAIKSTKKEFDKLKAARDADPQGFMQAQMAANGIQGSFKMNSVQTSKSSTSDVKSPKLNNPIEISEKK